MDENQQQDGGQDGQQEQARRRVGAQPGNANRLRHGGSRRARTGLALTALGKLYPQAYRDVLKLREAIETQLR